MLTWPTPSNTKQLRTFALATLLVVVAYGPTVLSMMFDQVRLPGLRLHVVGRSPAPAVQALITGEVEIAFVDAPTALPLMADKKIVPLGVSTLQRNPLAPDVPTIAESGFPGYEATSDFALLAPAGTPAPVLRKLAAATAAAMRNPEVLERLRQNSILPTVGTPEEWPAYFTAESAKWGDVIKTRGITLE